MFFDEASPYENPKIHTLDTQGIPKTHTYGRSAAFVGG
jgi:hypothetical protein